MNDSSKSNFEAKRQRLRSLGRSTRRLQRAAVALALIEISGAVAFSVYRSETEVFPNETVLEGEFDE